MSIVQSLIASISKGASAPPGPVESGTPGSSVVYMTGTVPTSGNTWPAVAGSDATINGSFFINSSGGINGIGINGGYVSVPVNLNQGHWTVELVCELAPSNFWATIWGNDSWSAGNGYIAYLSSSAEVDVGSPRGTNAYSVSDVSSRAHWVFTNTAGSITVYRNGSLIGSYSSNYTPPNSPVTSELYIGARHNNDGSSTAIDMCPGTYYFLRVRDYGVDANTVTYAYYNEMRTAYSLP